MRWLGWFRDEVMVKIGMWRMRGGERSERRGETDELHAAMLPHDGNMSSGAKLFDPVSFLGIDRWNGGCRFNSGERFINMKYSLGDTVFS